MRILVTNDDGYLATGIRVLADAVRELGEVDVVAPGGEQSATSHSLTVACPLRGRVSERDQSFPDDALPVAGTASGGRPHGRRRYADGLRHARRRRAAEGPAPGHRRVGREPRREPR